MNSLKLIFGTCTKSFLVHFLGIGWVALSLKKKKSILRTIRVSEELDSVIEKDAEDQNISANALITKIITHYTEWQRVVEKTSYILIASSLFRAIINEISDEKIEDIAKTVLPTIIKDLAMLEFGKTDFDSVLQTMFLIGKYETGLRTSTSIPVEGKESKYTLTLYHDWGPKGSLLFRNYFDNLIRNETGKLPVVNITDQVVTVSFPKSPKP
jgi:hypothetical protein